METSAQRTLDAGIDKLRDTLPKGAPDYTRVTAGYFHFVSRGRERQREEQLRIRSQRSPAGDSRWMANGSHHP